MLLAFKIFILVCIAICSAARNELLTTADCVCVGQISTYECSVVGGMYTVWKGTILPLHCEITLIHTEYSLPNGTREVCNNGDVVGKSIRVVDNCYTSRLNVSVSEASEGRTVECNVDDGSTTLIDVTTINITTDPFPPPEVLLLDLTNTPYKLTFTWTPVLLFCPTLHYNITSSNCGSCILSSASYSATCTDFMLQGINNVCNFAVQSVICGNIAGELKTMEVNLRVPSVRVKQSIPRYLTGRFNNLIAINTTFTAMESFNITNEFNGSALNYTIIYSELSFGSRCGFASIPASSCVNGVCSHVFDIFTSSSCPSSTAITVTVTATNLLGNGYPSNEVTTDGINNLVTVNFDSTQKTFTCVFRNQPEDRLKQCNVSIAYGETCENQLETSSGMDKGDSVTTGELELEIIQNINEYCFFVTASSGNKTVIVEGTLDVINFGSAQNYRVNLQAAVALPIVIIIAIVVAGVIGIIIRMMYKIKTRTPVVIKFSVKNNPGALAKALKVFEKYNINILGVNTHLHHASFDRISMKGYKDNYVYCICPKEKRDTLKRDLRLKYLEVIGADDNDQNPVTLKFSIKDEPGALRKALEIIEENDINMIGLNTATDRESTPGYRENHVKCKCSKAKEAKVVNALKRDVLALNVAVELLFPLNSRKIRCELLVVNKVGSITRALQVFGECGINLDGVNLDYLRNNDCNAGDGFIYNYVECYCAGHKREELCSRLRSKEYSAHSAEVLSLEEARPVNRVDHEDYCIIKFSSLNESGALVRALHAFVTIGIDIIGVNTLHCEEERDYKVQYKMNTVRFSSNPDEEDQLKLKLTSTGLVINIEPIPPESPSSYTVNESVEERRGKGNERSLKFFVKDDVGALAIALQQFTEQQIHIIGENMDSEQDVKSVDCKKSHIYFRCTEEEEDRLNRELKATGVVVDIKFADDNRNQTDSQQSNYTLQCEDQV